MGTYKGNAGNLMQHWTLCELLTIANKHAMGLSFIDAHAMAPLARERDNKPGYSRPLFDRVRAGLPGQSVYEQAWHNRDPNGEGYPNSAAFVEKVWKGKVSMLLCEKDKSTVTDLKDWEQTRAGVEIAEGDWRETLKKGLPDTPLTLVSFDPDMYDRRRVDTRNSRHLYPGDLELTLRALASTEGGVLIQLSTYSRGRTNDNPQEAVISSVDSILVGGGFTRAAKVRYDGNMMSLVYARRVSWSAKLAELPGRFEKWLKAQGKGDSSPCECGCGNYPKSPKSRYLPGHDAKHLAALVKELRAKESGP